MSQSDQPAGVAVDRGVRPRAWADDAVIAGSVGNCASVAAKEYWQRSHAVDRAMAERVRHPLYALDDAQIDALRRTVADALIGYRGRPDGPPRGQRPAAGRARPEASRRSPP